MNKKEVIDNLEKYKGNIKYRTLDNFFSVMRDFNYAQFDYDEVIEISEFEPLNQLVIITQNHSVFKFNRN